MLYSYRMTSSFLSSTQYHRQHCTFQAFEQLGALHMHNLDDDHFTRPGFEPSTSAFRATTGPNEPQLDPILYCQQLASPRECVLIIKKIGKCPYRLYTLDGTPEGALQEPCRCPPDIPYTLRPPAGSCEGYLRAPGRIPVTFSEK